MSHSSLRYEFFNTMYRPPLKSSIPYKFCPKKRVVDACCGSPMYAPLAVALCLQLTEEFSGACFRGQAEIAAFSLCGNEHMHRAMN